MVLQGADDSVAAAPVVDAAEEIEIAQPVRIDRRQHHDREDFQRLDRGLRALPVAVDGHKADAAFCSCDPLLDRLTDVEHFADEKYFLFSAEKFVEQPVESRGKGESYAEFGKIRCHLVA